VDLSTLDQSHEQLDPQPRTGDVAANAVDDDASTRYSTGQGQAPGEYLQVDLGRGEILAELVLDSGASTGDYPRGDAVTVSLDGTIWSTPVAPEPGLARSPMSPWIAGPFAISGSR
jgi:hypothetical protein